MVFTRVGSMIAALLSFAALAVAQEIPALVEISSQVAAAHPELVSQRAALVQEREALHAQFNQHNQRCTDIDPDNKAKISDCAGEHAELLAALKAHIARSEGFNAAARSAWPAAQRDQTRVDICSQVPKAQDDWTRLKGEVALDEQVIRNFGFQQTSDEIQAWGELGEDARLKLEKTREDVLMGVVTDGIVGGFREIGHGLTPLRAEELTGKLTALLQRGGVPAGDELYEIARHVGAKASVEETDKLVRAIDRIHDGYDLQRAAVGAAGAENNLEILKSAAELAGVFNPEIGLLAKDLNTLSLAVYATQYAVARDHVEKLTHLTEDQLKDLQTRTEKLKKDVRALNAAKKILEASKVQNCDSTKLVRNTP